MSLYGYPREPEPLDDEESFPPAAGGSAGTGVIPAQRPAIVTEPLGPAEPAGRHRSGAHQNAVAQSNGHAAPEEFAWLRPSGERPGFGPSPTMGQPVLGQPPATVAPASAVPASAIPVSPVSAPVPAPVPPPAPVPAAPQAAPRAAAPEPTTRLSTPTPETEAALAALLDEPEVQPWDRRPLMVVIASAIVLVLIGVAAGVVSASVVRPRPDRPGVVWQEPDPVAPDGS